MPSLGVLIVVTFFLHLIWERAHIVLYRDYDVLKGRLPVPVFAALGDVLYTAIAIAIISAFHGALSWILMPNVYDYVGLAFFGFCTSLFVEYKAFALGRWKYSPAMPLFPLLRVGLSPVFQKTLLFL